MEYAGTKVGDHEHGVDETEQSVDGGTPFLKIGNFLKVFQFGSYSGDSDEHEIVSKYNSKPGQYEWEYYSHVEHEVSLQIVPEDVWFGCMQYSPVIVTFEETK